MKRYTIQSGSMKLKVDAEDPKEACLSAIESDQPDLLGVSVLCTDEDGAETWFETDYLLLDLGMLDRYT
jgi:hypothetical protein